MSKHRFRLSTFIAVRYLFSRKKRTVVNVISWISLIGIAVSTVAMIVVLSVYNGIGALTQSLFNVFDPELIIEPKEGKTFHTSEIALEEIRNTEGISSIAEIVEENAWITHRQSESIVQLRGVDVNYAATCGIDTLIEEGEYCLRQGENYFLILGNTIRYNLEVNQPTNTPLAVHIPKRGTTSIGLTMDEAFNNGYAYLAGSFRLQEDLDSKYVLADIDFVRRLMSYAPDEVTALVVSTTQDKEIAQLKAVLSAKVGEEYTVKDRYDQNPLYYKIFRTERLGVFLILSLIVLIATLNLIASLSLLIINKRNDIATFQAMGLERKSIRGIFFTEGVLIAMVGEVAGLILGLAICLLQQQYGIVKLGANAVVEAFPVAMRVVDFVATFLVVSILATGVVGYTTHRAFKN